MTKKENKQIEFKKSVFAQEEEKVLDFWDKAEIFKKSVETPPSPIGHPTKGEGNKIKDYVFYDGPPFGTGEPHYGHILSSVSKDVIPRYWTMKGYRVKRRWGWDCHGLPIENIIEKEMGISGKKEIEKIGIDKFNEACRSQVLKYADIWDVMVRRIARWVDFKNSYKTMDSDFMESVWWGFKQLWDKDLIYQGRKVLLYCPRCETPISNFEVAMDNSYKDINETSVYVKFKINIKSIKDGILRSTQNDNGDLYILAWTTTPWTLPGNVALAVGNGIKYQLLSIKGDSSFYVISKDRVETVFQGIEYKVEKEIDGKDLVGLKYEPLFDVPALKNAGKEKTYTVASADFVTTEDGTGVVHTAVVYGEDDYNLGLKLDLPIIPALDEKGHFNETVPQFKGMYFKKANSKIIEDLDKRQLLFKKEDIIHSYPHCHRCDTQLFYNAIPAWFLAIAKIRDKLIKQNENINWYPKHLKEGRFKIGLEGAPDWNISRNRYFATPMPIWECNKCKEREVIGSIKELEEKSGKKNIKDIHSHFIDDLNWKCAKCNGTMKRISEVFDCWVESGSMAFAEHHYMGEPLTDFDPIKGKRFPAQYISEYISQTRAWFYVMHVMSVALFGLNSFENVVTTGVILNEKGEKMSKSKKNYPDPWKVINGFGVDALRMYLMSSSIMHAENLFFNEQELKVIFRKNIMLLWNIHKFYEMFAGEEEKTISEDFEKPENILDKWILLRLNQLIEEITKSMDDYDLPRSARPIADFIDDFSTWYVRRSRDRFKGDNLEDKKAAINTMGYVLCELSKVIAPFMPFIAERVWQSVTGNNFNNNDRSVHLEAWPAYATMATGKQETFDNRLVSIEILTREIDKKILDEMSATRKIVELALKARDEAGIKIRQPLNKITVIGPKTIAIKNAYIELIKDEVNISDVEFKGNGKEIKVSLDTVITADLKQAGAKRELVRFINSMRKNAGFTINDKIEWEYSGGEEIKAVIDKYIDDLKKDTLAININEILNIKEGKEVEINKEKIILRIKKFNSNK